MGKWKLKAINCIVTCEKHLNKYYKNRSSLLLNQNSILNQNLLYLIWQISFQMELNQSSSRLNKYKISLDIWGNLIWLQIVYQHQIFKLMPSIYFSFSLWVWSLPKKIELLSWFYSNFFIFLWLIKQIDIVFNINIIGNKQETNIQILWDYLPLSIKSNWVIAKSWFL